MTVTFSIFLRIFASTPGGFFASKLAATIQNFRRFLHPASKVFVRENEKKFFGTFEFKKNVSL